MHEEASEGGPAPDPHQHVLRVAGDGEHRADIRAHGKADEVHVGPHAEGQERGEEDRSHDQANRVVDEERGEQASADHDGEEQPSRRPGALEHELRGPLEESSYLEVADDQHHAEQEDEHVEVHGGVRVLERQHAEHDHRDGPDQAGRGPIEVDERQPLDGDEEIGCDEDQETGGHTNAECGMD